MYGIQAMVSGWVSGYQRLIGVCNEWFVNTDQECQRNGSVNCFYFIFFFSMNLTIQQYCSIPVY